MNFFKKWNLRRKMHHRADVINAIAYRLHKKALVDWTIGDEDAFYLSRQELQHLTRRYFRIQRWLGR